MSKRPVTAITFDLWDTVIVDDSEEPRRKELGLPPKPVERRDLVHAFLNKHEPISREEVDLAYNVTDAAFRKVWHDQHFTWSVRERLSVLLNGLGRELPEPEFAELIELHENMELRHRPDLVQNFGPILEELHKNYKLGVISDTIFSPGTALRELLKGEDLLKHFDAFIFSDEAGCSKPHPGVFEKAAEALGVEIPHIVHVGDREHNDVGGPHAVGARAIFTTVIKDRGYEDSKADAICHDYKDLPAIVAKLDQR